jgi:hypothetical protein
MHRRRAWRVHVSEQNGSPTEPVDFRTAPVEDPSPDNGRKRMIKVFDLLRRTSIHTKERRLSVTMRRITCKAFKRLDEKHLPLYRTEWMETETVPTRRGIRAWRFSPGN